MSVAIRLRLIFILFVGLTPILLSETRWPDSWTSGYGRSLRGETIDYHSPHPDVRSALLVRSIDSSRAIEWETSANSRAGNQDTVFVWIYAMDCNDDVHAFDLWINGGKSIRFENPRESENVPRTFRGDDGSELTFHPLSLDRAMDAMGYAVLRIPRSRILARKPQTLRVSGESAGSPVWYMTFQSVLEETIVIRPRSRVLHALAGPIHSVDCEIVRVGDPVQGAITVEGGNVISFELKPGFNAIPLPVREVERRRDLTAWVQIGSHSPARRSFTVSPVRPWTVYLVQHTHTDIGYTRPQTEILSEHLRYIDTALDFCDQTDSLPDDARFRWTCETSWAVREYLNTRPRSQIERLKGRIQEGRIEVTGMMFNLSDLSDENTLAAQLLPIRQFHDEGIPVRTAMQSDVNGAGWCLIDGLKSAGVEFFNMAQNTHRALEPFDRPTAFWWESPSGNRILAFRADHYMTGNGIGLIDPDSIAFEKGLVAHLEELEKSGYPFHEIAIQYSGYFTDNSPPSTIACGRVVEWNRRTVWPKIRLATIHEFPEHIRDNRSIPLPIFRAAWPDWWTDGFGSAALETAFGRTVHTDLIAHQGLFSMARLLGIGINQGTLNRLESVLDDLNFYDEHTFGAAESIWEPNAENSVVQWGEKGAYVWAAVKKNRLLREEAMGLLQSFVPRSDRPLVAVYNTMNWPRSGLVEVFIDHQILPCDRDFRILDPTSRPVPAQAMKTREEGTTWALWVTDVPPLGVMWLRVEAGSEKAKTPPEVPFRGSLENDFYRISLDSARGTIRNLVDKTLKRDMVDSTASWGFGQWIYERLGSDRHQLELKTLHTVTRTPLSDIAVGRIIEGPIWSSMSWTGQSPECVDNRGVRSEIRLYHTDRRIEFRFSMRKRPVADPEGVYVAFPFALPGGTTVFEVQGGVVAPGKNQLEGSSTDWNGIQNFASVRNEREQIVFVSPEIPLVQFGGINLGRFQRLPSPSKPHFFSWVLNNYWTTNFRATQEGELNWSYILTSSADPSIRFATRFGWGVRIPLLARVFPFGHGQDPVQSHSVLDLPAESLLLVSSRPSLDGRGVILYLREVDGRSFTWECSGLATGGRSCTVSEVNILEEPIRQNLDRVSFRPYDVKWLKVE